MSRCSEPRSGHRQCWSTRWVGSPAGWVHRRPHIVCRVVDFALVGPDILSKVLFSALNDNSSIGQYRRSKKKRAVIRHQGGKLGPSSVDVAAVDVWG